MPTGILGSVHHPVLDLEAGSAEGPSLMLASDTGK